MSLSEFVSSIKGWVNFEYTDEVVTSWIRMAEERISEELRCREMIEFDQATFTNDPRVPLPSDWVEMDLVRIIGRDKPLEYTDRHDFYWRESEGFYTIIGSYIAIGGKLDEVNGTTVEIAYYNRVPPLTNNGPTWLYSRYPRLYTAATLTMAVAYGVEDDRAPLWEAETKSRIDMMNISHLKSRTSGSRLKRRPVNRSFG